MLRKNCKKKVERKRENPKMNLKNEKPQQLGRVTILKGNRVIRAEHFNVIGLLLSPEQRPFFSVVTDVHLHNRASPTRKKRT